VHTRQPSVRVSVGFVVALVVAALVAASCSSEPDTEASSAATVGSSALATSASEPTTAATSPAPTTSRATTSTTSSTTSTSTTTTIPTIATSTTDSSTASPPVAVTVPQVFGALDLSADVVELGRSVEGRPIVAERYGSPGGRKVLVIGVIHGDEDDGVGIIEQLRASTVPEGVELWLVESMNPDGQAAQVRQNANQVDLNRNFPYKWGPISVPGDGQYAGVGPASEPETQSMVNFISQLRPDIAIWYHQDLFVISPAEGREGRVRARYAELTGLPLGGISGGRYTGIAATWARIELADAEGVAFIVELGGTLSTDEAATHAAAVLTIGSEG
jgi:murein peptide amidase A